MQTFIAERMAGYEDYGYSVFQHALNAVSKGLSDEKCLDWLQIHGANAELNPKSRIGRHTANFIAMKEAKEAKKEQAKLDAKKRKLEHDGKTGQKSQEKISQEIKISTEQLLHTYTIVYG